MNGNPSGKSNGEHALIAIFEDKDGEEAVHFVHSLEEAEVAISDADIQEALGLAGVWSDLDWSETEAALTRIRAESKPSPSVSL
ncbi:MAG: hypothetical protein ACYDCQ_06705 [Dehalococcoidia bacterium]